MQAKWAVHSVISEVSASLLPSFVSGSSHNSAREKNRKDRLHYSVRELLKEFAAIFKATTSIHTLFTFLKILFLYNKL
jgi:hypothetical protein